TLEFTLQVDRSDDAGTVRRVLRHHRVHLFMPAELGHLLARAGLRVLDRYGDFGGGPVTGESERPIYRCGGVGGWRPAAPATPSTCSCRPSWGTCWRARGCASSTATATSAGAP